MTPTEWTRCVVGTFSATFVLACGFAMVLMVGIVLPMLAARVLWDMVVGCP